MILTSSFPCAKCGDPAAQIRSTHEHMKGHSYGMLWLDIEGPQYWHSDHSSNINFIQGMLNEAKALGNVSLNANRTNLFSFKVFTLEFTPASLSGLQLLATGMEPLTILYG